MTMSMIISMKTMMKIMLMMMISSMRSPLDTYGSSKFYFSMKSRLPAQENIANILEDRNKHYQLPEAVISLIFLVFLLTKHKVDKKLFDVIIRWLDFRQKNIMTYTEW